jgi:hypothetical protein
MSARKHILLLALELTPGLLPWCRRLRYLLMNLSNPPFAVFCSNSCVATEKGFEGDDLKLRGASIFLSRRAEFKSLSHSFFSPGSWRVPHKALRAESKAEFGKKVETAVRKL